VFLDFQKDSVYIILEDLKQKQEGLMRKLRHKDTEIARTNMQVASLQRQVKENANTKLMMEQANSEMVTKLFKENAELNRLKRRIETASVADDAFDIDEEEPQLRVYRRLYSDCHFAADPGGADYFAAGGLEPGLLHVCE